jgi:hypothetical protein
MSWKKKPGANNGKQSKQRGTESDIVWRTDEYAGTES